ncbi:MAG: hypothetical protein A2Z72_05405 [Omnitrophica bacterium RBG_13_46_9]|nr:MAG: hypothetical protein A2Z72_05405 [Omnitrophica bacterium RBG_13_46_9]
MKILFLVPYPTEGASNRFRVEQYLPYLEEKGILYKVRPFISSDFYRILYLKDYLLKKILFFLRSTVFRILDVLRALKYDIIFIHRESYPLGPPFIERILKFFNKKVIFDFDDAIFLPASSGSNIFMERFNRYGKVPEVIALSDGVITGNKYLADFALKYNENVTIIPTPVDVELYAPSPKKIHSEKVTIGWIGSKTTSVFLKPMRDIFAVLLEKFPYLEIIIVGGRFDNRGLERVRNIDWSLENEIGALQNFDIGIMPMPDTKWTRGKCAFKAILYMSVGIPCVSSPVGVTADLIKDGVNGFLAGSADAWKKKLSMLIESPDLRERIGRNARETAVNEYSVKANVPKFLEVLNRVKG